MFRAARKKNYFLAQEDTELELVFIYILWANAQPWSGDLKWCILGQNRGALSTLKRAL